jgi:uncharacterized Zn-finger protein
MEDADHAPYPKFCNDLGVKEIAIGAREFECIGARPPHDHPHIYLDMGNETSCICPYCGTHYKYRSALQPHQAEPAACALEMH